MAKIIVAKDPRGVIIYCEENEWEQHIISPDRHPIMKDNVEAIIETIESPEVIYESHDSSPPLDYREVFSKKAESATYYSTPAPYTKVVVSVCGGSGEIITAYNAANTTGGTKGEALYRAKNKG